MKYTKQSVKTMLNSATSPVCALLNAKDALGHGSEKHEFATDKNVWKDTPKEGHVLLERNTPHYRRTVNGAWVGNGADNETYEIPLSHINSPEGAGWLSPGYSSVNIKTPDGGYVSVDGMSTPMRTSGFGELGHVKQKDQWGNEIETLVNRPNKHFPNLVPVYYGFKKLSDGEMATFKPLEG